MKNTTLFKFFKNSQEQAASRSQEPPPRPLPSPRQPVVQPPPTCIVEEEYPSDPALRKNIYEYDVKERENVRRYYLQKGPCQPKDHNFPWRYCANEKCRFQASWFKEYPNWLEYSITTDAVYCLYCYLFKADHGGQGGGDSFVSGEGFKNWRKKMKLNGHVGDHTSMHNKCVRAGYDLLKQSQHIEHSLATQCIQTQADYRLRLTASIDCIKWLLRQGLAFRSHDESQESQNKGNFLELLQFLCDHNENIDKVALKKAPENHKLTSPQIQQEIITSIAKVTTNAIISDLGDELFTILVHEARDISVKEQMAVVLRFVDERGHIMQGFLGIVHVGDTTALSLKAAIESLLSQHGLCISSIRGQGYDGASNMRGEFNGLKSLIMMENESAYYVHCFAHQLQLTLVAVAEGHGKISVFFDIVTSVSNIVGASCKRRDILREKQFEKVVEGVYNGDILTGQGKNQEMTLKRAGSTRWGSHYGTLMSLICLYSSVIDVIVIVEEDAKDKKIRGQAENLLGIIAQFEFAFHLHLMKNILGITNDLSQALQRKDQDIINTVTLVRITKQQLQNMRDDGWQSLLEEVSSFCVKHKIVIPPMDELFVQHGRSHRNFEGKTNIHYYRIELFYEVIDLQLQELNNRFNEANTKLLLLCMACLDPSDSFSAYDKRKLLRLAEFYPSDFSNIELMHLDRQLDTYILDVHSDDRFSEVAGISRLARKLVQLKKHRAYPLVYLLLKLALLLPVATATVERVFSAMKIIKTSLRNRLGDEMMNDCLVAYIERDLLDAIDNEDIIQYFQNMKSRRVLLLKKNAI